MDLHPEELLDREAAGELTRLESERLEVHLRHCPACRLERRARKDFQRTFHPADSEVRALIAGVLLPERSRATRAIARSRFARFRFALVAAALVVLTGLAAAAASSWSQRFAGKRAAVAAGVGAANAGSAGRAGIRPGEGLPPPAAVDAPAGDASARSTGSDSAAVSRTSPPRRAALAKTATETRSPRAAADDAAGLFGEANASRRRGEHERAATAYERLIAGYPQSAEARESLESLGRMRLDDGDGAGALQCFDAYLRRGGALIAEAMVGRALALEQLGRIDQERDAWRALVDAFPDSVHADRARTRLAKLGR